MFFRKAKKENVETWKNHIKQNDAECLPEIQKIGCFFRSCGLIAEYRTGRNLTAPQINATWKWAKQTKRIDENNCVKDSASIATRFLRELGDNGRFYEVGLFKDGTTTFYPSVKNTEYARIDALIQKVETSGPEGTHFRVVDKMGKLIEDPHDPEINFKKIMYSILYCYEG